jgi:hypothetical protein
VRGDSRYEPLSAAVLDLALVPFLLAPAQA